ncbi:hypothetical protein [Campylobacter concisus]|nr:hypothetical protein [Campylobacter concisus]
MVASHSSTKPSNKKRAVLDEWCEFFLRSEQNVFEELSFCTKIP